MRISDWSSDVCSSDLPEGDCREELHVAAAAEAQREEHEAEAEGGAGEAEVDGPVDRAAHGDGVGRKQRDGRQAVAVRNRQAAPVARRGGDEDAGEGRSEEHTSELQSLMRISYAV